MRPCQAPNRHIREEWEENYTITKHKQSITDVDDSKIIGAEISHSEFKHQRKIFRR
jgi:arylamine N-acetyltransferase